MEYFDVLDENGVPTEEILPRDDVHRQGLWHRGVIGILANEDGEVLLQQRSKRKEKFPGVWDVSVAGHVSSGEDAYSALVRELSEEIGVLVTRDAVVKNCRFLKSFKNVHSYFDRKLNQEVFERCIYALFIVKIGNKSNSGIKLNDYEVQDFQWKKYL